jgi:hypothetical protein
MKLHTEETGYKDRDVGKIQMVNSKHLRRPGQRDALLEIF